MDAWALNLKSGGLALKTRQSSSASSWRVFGGGEIRFLEVRVSARKGRSSPLSCRSRTLVVRATGKKKNHDNPSSSGNNESSIPEGDGPEDTDPTIEKPKSDDAAQKPHHKLLDWRDFRANLVAREQVQLLDSGAPTPDTTSLEQPSQWLGPKWAHPIPVPEPGCVLVATEKLDGVRSFERTVVLLLRLGTRDPREGPLGVIINRPLHKKIKHMKPAIPDLATTFADCSLHFGGPLDASMFLMKTGENSSIPGFEQVVPGVCFGAKNSLDEAAALVKKGVLRAQDFRFFVGYAGWQLDQLRDEIESDYWVVAACSSYLIGGASKDSSAGMWEEILQLMGGRYAELSQKPKEDSS